MKLTLLLLIGLAFLVNTVQSKDCFSDGKRYKPGEMFKSDCNNCKCFSNGLAGCTMMACNVPAIRPIKYHNLGQEEMEQNDE